MSFNVQRPSQSAFSDDSRYPILRFDRKPSERGVFCSHNRAVTLVEVMVALTLLATVMLGVMSTFIQSRRITESGVLHAAATSLIYGIIEQIKQLDYTTQLPNYETDPFAPNTKTPPYFRVRINQNTVKWIKVVHTTVPAPTVNVPNPTPTPAAPATKPAISATATSLNAVENLLGSIPLSTITGTTSQEINLDIWVWIDDIPDSANDVSEVKKVTVVYTYSYQDGAVTRTVRDWEVFLRTRFEQ